MYKFNRIIILVLDSVACGVQEDYKNYHKEKSNTLLSVYKSNPGLKLPNLESLGLDKILFNKEINNPYCAGKCKTKTAGNDTYSSIWEMIGIPFKERYRSEKKGFDKKLIDKIEAEFKIPIICNEYIAGFKAMDKYFELHKKTRAPMLYFAQDGIVLLAAHEKIIKPRKLTILGSKLAKILENENVVRVITRPFIGKPGNFTRSKNRKDFIIAKNPFNKSALENLWRKDIGLLTTEHIYGILGRPENAEALRGTFDNKELTKIIEYLIIKQKDPYVMMFVLNDFDTMGHKKDPIGYGRELKNFDNWVGKIKDKLDKKDLLVLTADHGCNPLIDIRGHTREAVPLMFYSPENDQKNWLGTRESLADIGQTITHNYELPSIENGVPIYEIFKF